MAEAIKPALTPDEWEKFARHGMGSMQPLRDRFDNRLPDSPEDWHALAAIALYSEPFGFTHEDVKVIREMARVAQDFDNTMRRVKSLRSLADRLAALLPPDQS